MYLDNALVKSLVAKNPTKIESQMPENYNAEVMQKLFKEQLNMELNGSLIAMSVSGMCKTQEEFDRRNLIIKCEHILWEKCYWAIEGNNNGFSSVSLCVSY